MKYLKKIIPNKVIDQISLIRTKYRRSYFESAVGELVDVGSGKTFVMVVGSTFDERRPDAMMVARQGYCNAFEKMGIPYLIVDIRNVAKALSSIKNPFCMLYSSDLGPRSSSALAALKDIPLAVWVHPWFSNSDYFFQEQGLDKALWDTPEKIKQYILDLNPQFIFSATLESGAHFFSEWVNNGVPFLSLPLACDTSRYNESIIANNCFAEVELAFVGGYWPSKGVQLDAYLRQLESKLTVYGYSEWPYANYGGKIDALKEPVLYASAAICPVINEPTVSLLHGQINERVFKVLGSGGFPIVDNVPQYRALFNSDELVIADSSEDFRHKVEYFIARPDEREKYMLLGRQAVFSRHTYEHRAKVFLDALNFG